MKDVRNWIIVALLAALPLAVLGGVLAQQQRATTTIDGRVWQSVASPDQFYVSIRAGGGSWAEAGAIPVSLDSLSESGAHRYGDFSVSVAMPAPPPPAATPTPVASETATAAPGGAGPGGGETSPTRTIAIESTPEATPNATPEPSATATVESSATVAPDTALRLAENALASAQAAYDAAWRKAYAVYEQTWRAAFATHRDRAAGLQGDRDAIAASYAAYQRQELAAAAALEAAVAAEREALNAAKGAWAAALDAAQADE